MVMMMSTVGADKPSSKRRAASGRRPPIISAEMIAVPSQEFTAVARSRQMEPSLPAQRLESLLSSLCVRSATAPTWL